MLEMRVLAMLVAVGAASLSIAGTVPTGSNIFHEDVFYKPGKCPNTTGVMSRCMLTDENCFSDDDCFGRLKCCPYGCNRECLDPEPEDLCPYECNSAYIPVCGNDGQTYANLCRMMRATCRNPYLKMHEEGLCKGSLKENRGVFI
ncbi:tomoregulin-2-like [Penaeus chinensis]|uniref:tomoregulin-2-like n=1 Tax=Penaeus chinensis TaxID=139456 RepID=UPI001FB7F0BB|nr:tomoregulin-2-like [Penaeus chinensis]